ncbi:MAG TPA: PilN domain-containing protein [Desulfuromonadales bacterium]|nr:PilN domain-containing protein [Desulfuromonadales bacterium]
MQIHLNLATRPYLNRRMVRFWLFLASIGLVLILGLNLVYGYQNYRQYRQVGELTQELDRRMAEVEEVVLDEFSPAVYEQAMAKVATLNQILEADQFRWTALLSRLELLVPDEVRISSLRPNFKERSLEVQAFSRDVEGMTDFLDALLRSEQMNQVLLLSHREQEVRQSSGPTQRVIGFSLQIKEAF